MSRKRFLLHPLSQNFFLDLGQLDKALEMAGFQLLANQVVFVSIEDQWHVGRPVIGKGQVPFPCFWRDLRIFETQKVWTSDILFSFQEELKKLSKGQGLILQVNSALDENNTFDLSFKMIEYVHLL